MLITDKKTTMKLNERLTEFSKFGMTFYYLLEEGRISINEVSDIFFSTDDEKSTFRYMNTIRKIMPEDVDSATLRYQNHFAKEDLTDSEYINKLNMFFTAKIINEVANKNEVSIDRTYINTYNYLLDQDSEVNNLSYGYGK